MDQPEKVPSLIEAAKELDAADEFYRVACENERKAQLASTDALNRLNRAQKAFDTVIRLIRQSAPVASGWKQLKQGLGALNDLPPDSNGVRFPPK